MIMKELHAQSRLYVATLKDGESVRLILQKHGLALADSQLLDQSRISTKLEALRVICHAEDLNKQELVLLDDNIIHLLEPALEGYKVYLATWQQPLPEYLSLARSRNIEIISNINQIVVLNFEFSIVTE